MCGTGLRLAHVLAFIVCASGSSNETANVSAVTDPTATTTTEHRTLLLNITHDANFTIPDAAPTNHTPPNNVPGNFSSSAPEAYAATDDGYMDMAAGYVALGFLGFAILGHVAFVLWRRYLEKKYGNSQTLITDDVYDISDLKSFDE